MDDLNTQVEELETQSEESNSLFFYAQIDEDNLCIGLSQLSGKVDSPLMIPLAEEQYASGDVVGKAYQDGEWVGVPTEDELQTATTVSNEEIAEQQLVIMDALAGIFEAIIEGGL